ncbi:MAG: inorganic phosphate transporter [Flavonifractor plautii]
MLAVVLVNGWTDAPNAIATVVSTGVLSFRRAVALAAACNLLGVLVMTAINATVAETVYSIADFGPDRAAALSALCAALCAIVLWAVLAWRFRCPPVRAMPWWPGSPGPPWPCPAGWTTSGLEPGDGYSWDWSSPWRWAGGWAACAAVCWSACTPPSPLPPRPTGRGGRYGLPPRGPGRAEISGRLSPGRRAGPGGGVGQTFSVPGWLMLLCAAVMALGTAMGGRRIIETVGRDMVILAPEGLAADLGADFACSCVRWPAFQ